MINDNLKIFTHTSDKPYDQNQYKINFKNGKSIIVEDYTSMKHLWYQWREQVTNVEIITDKKNQYKKEKKKGGKGF